MLVGRVSNVTLDYATRRHLRQLVSDMRRGVVLDSPDQAKEADRLRKRAERARLQNGAPSTSFCECGCGGFVPLATRTDKRRGLVSGRPIRFIRGHNTGIRRRGLRFGQRESA
jgi:hypothetical protein